MPRKILIRTSEAPYHVTNRSNNREMFYIPNWKLWPIFIEVFKELRLQFGCEIHGFVLMTNHYHLLISTPKKNLGEAMKYLHREVARKSNRECQRINHFFGGRYKWSLIVEEPYYWNSIKYIFRNPVRAGICDKVQDYPFSSLNVASVEWAMTDVFNNRLKIDLDRNWLNEPFLKEVEQGLGKALRRRSFEMPRDKSASLIRFGMPSLRKGTVTSSGKGTVTLGTGLGELDH